MGRARHHEIRGPGGSLPLRPGDEAAMDLAMLVAGETSGRPLDDVLAEFGRSRSTYYEKLRRFREQGLEGLLARPPGPRSPWRRPLEVVRHVVTTRLRNPDRTPSAIVAELAGLGHTVSVRSVERTLAQFGLTRQRGARTAAADHGKRADSTPCPTPASTPATASAHPEGGAAAGGAEPQGTAAASAATGTRAS